MYFDLNTATFKNIGANPCVTRFLKINCVSYDGEISLQRSGTASKPAMNRAYFLILFFLYFSASAWAQPPAWQWAREAYSPANEQVSDVVFDESSGELFVGGFFESMLTA